jgi:hypothetical protein
MHRLAELAELSQLDSEGNLVPLSDLPDADRRVIAVAANSILDRAFGKPKAAEGEKDDMGAQIASMSREQRLALMRMLLEPMRRYLPAAKTATSRGQFIPASEGLNPRRFCPQKPLLRVTSSGRSQGSSRLTGCTIDQAHSCAQQRALGRQSGGRL